MGSIRMLRVARCGAVKARTQADNQLRDLIVTAPGRYGSSWAGCRAILVRRRGPATLRRLVELFDCVWIGAWLHNAHN